MEPPRPLNPAALLLAELTVAGARAVYGSRALTYEDGQQVVLPHLRKISVQLFRDDPSTASIVLDQQGQYIGGILGPLGFVLAVT